METLKYEKEKKDGLQRIFAKRNEVEFLDVVSRKMLFRDIEHETIEIKFIRLD